MSSTGFLERLRQGYRGYRRTGSPPSFLESFRQHQDQPPQRYFQRSAEAFAAQPLSDTVVVKLRAVMKVLSCGEDDRLKLALTYHDQARVEELADVMSQLGQEGNCLLQPLRLFRADLEAFRKWCLEVSQLYTYFIFLDLKGDRGLLDLKDLQKLLAITSSSIFLASLRKTRSFVHGTWLMMARKEPSQLLLQAHRNGLQRWCATEPKAFEPKAFWDTCFSGQHKVLWCDFLDSLQEHFFQTFCPKDLQKPLRQHLCKKSCHHVARQHWEELVETYGHISKILDMLLQEVLADLSSTIYRKEEPEVAVKPKIQGLRANSPLGRSRPRGDKNSQARKTVKADGEAELAGPGSHTPEDPRPHLEPGKKMDWEAYVDELCTAELRWWTDCPPSEEEDKLRLAAMRAVESDLVCSRHALLLRVVSGELAKQRPVLEFGGEVAQLPAVLVSPNDVTMSPAVTKFGRGSKRKMMPPDLLMNEPIASRSHFSISFDATRERYQIQDAGSKWGTFLKVRAKEPLCCGDWIRIGNAELVIRFCGGLCKSKRHADRRPSLLTRAMSSFSGLQHLSLHPEDPEEEPHQLSVGRQRAWWTSVDKMCHNPQLQSETRINSGATPLPWAPLELDFVSGPRMGERLVLTERHITIGRAETCTIQISDPMLANVSRTHCIIQNDGKGAWLVDNSSTNGTWRRLSCVLEPSEPLELKSGDCVLAGVHEFRVEEAEMPCDWIPSCVGRALQAALQA